MLVAILRSGSQFLGLCLLAFLLLAGPARPAAAQVSLTLGDATLAPGDSGTVTATIATDGAAVALQFDILYDPTRITLGTVNGGGALTGDHSIASNPIGPGRDRVVVTTTPVTPLGSGSLAIINLTVDGGAPQSTTPVSFDGVVIADASAQPITPASLTPGTITITGAAVTPVQPEAIPASPAWALLLLVALLVGVVRRLRPARGRPVAASLVMISCLGALALPAHSQGLPGDANGDGRIDVEDVRLIVERILERGVLPGDGDCNRDATINVLDTVCSQLPFVPGETAPIILGPGDRSIPAGSLFEMNLFAADPDAGATQTWALLSGPAGLAVSPAGELSWTPAAGNVGPNPVSIRVTDDTGRADEATFSINVFLLPAAAPENARPVLTVPGNRSLPVGTPLAAQASATDPDVGDTISFALVDGPVGMTIDSSTGTLNWTPQPGQAGTADVVIKVTDSAGASAFGSFQVTATPINTAPTAKDDVYIARKGETLVIPPREGVLINDTDPNGDALEATRQSDPVLGTVDGFNPDGSFTYTPREGSGITIGLAFKCETDLWDFGVGSGTASAADVDGDGKVELVGLSNTVLGSRVFIVDPTDCSAVVNPIPAETGQPPPESVATLVNIDDDPELEVVTHYFRFASALPDDGSPEPGNRLMAVNLDGTPVTAWPLNGLSESPQFGLGFNGEYNYASPVAVDLDGDGESELLAAYTQVGPSGLPEGTCRAALQNTTCNAVVAWDGRTGAVRWTYIGGVTPPRQRSMSPTLVDLDLDGDTEIIWNQLVLDHEGNLVFELPVERTIPVAGFELYGNDLLTVAIGNFDNDAFPEIIGYDASNFYLFSHDGNLQWQRPYAGSGFGFPWTDLTLAELDGDPFPELVTMLRGDGGGALTLRAFDSDGEPLWDNADSYPVGGQVSGSSSPVAFDLDGDGIDEIIQFRTDTPTENTAGLYILDGGTGDVITSIVDRTLGRAYNDGDEPLTVVDLDGDGSAEIVTNFNREFGFDRLNIWDNLPGEPFPPARPVRSQTNVQPTWVNVDGSLPASLEPHWLQPGRNYWNRIVPDLDPLAPEQDSFTYRVSDGEFDSTAATVNIEIRPNGNPPFFLSEPKRGTSAGIAYEYQPLVTDVDPGDSVTFELLNGPTGMTLDPATGAIDWYPESNGDYPVSIGATDTLGLSSAQIYTLTVGDPVQVPDIIGLSEAAAGSTLDGAGLALGSRFFRSDPVVPAGEVVDQAPPAGAVAELGASVRVTLSSGPTQADTDGDGDGFTPNEGDCNDDSATVYPGAPEIDGDGIDQSCNGIDGDKTLVAIEVTPTDRRLLAGEPQPLRAMGIFEDGTAQDLTQLASWSRGPTFFSASAGAFTAEAGFQGVTGSAEFEVVATIDEDAAPIARIEGPGNGVQITTPTNITGTARDTNLLRWELAYQYAGEDAFVTFAEGDFSRSSSPLGTFDPSVLENGQYRLRLRVFDRGGNRSEDELDVIVAENYKPGLFTYSFIDLQMPLSGVPITVIRTYDSRVKREGDFGVGWQLGLKTIQLQKSRELGSAWRVNRSGLSYFIVPTAEHSVSITLPDGRVEVFDLAITPGSSPIVPFPPFANRGRFEPRPGTRGTLRTLENDFLTVLDPQPGPVNFLDDSSNEVFDPDLFLYVTEDGTTFTISERDGLREVVDPNGNSLQINDDGITHSSGASVLFSRDESRRIEAVTDALGNAQFYRYDSNGDLVAHTDREGNVTRFFYDSRHNLIRIEDPEGNVPLRNVYDDAGRLVRQIDADGNEVLFEHDLAARQEVVTDRTGAVSVYEYDEFGNVVSESDALGNTTRSTYDARGNLATRVDPLGNEWLFSHDESGRPTRRTDPLGNTTTWIYDESGNLLSSTSPSGATTEYTYDTRGNLLSETDALGNVRRHTYDAQGNLLLLEDRNGNAMEMRYDASGFLVERLLPSGATELRDLDDAGKVLSIQYQWMVDGEPRTQQWQFSYDANGNEVSVTDPASGAAFATEYDGNSRPSGGTTSTGRYWSAQRSARGDLVAVADEAGFGYQAVHDVEGRPTAVTGSGLATLNQAYDAVGNPVELRLPGGDAATSEYDALNREVARVDPAGERDEFDYDALGRLTVATTASGGTLRRDFDEEGNIVRGESLAGGEYRYEYDALNRLTQITRPDGLVMNREYDGEGNLLQSHDDFGIQYRHTYNELGLLTTTETPSGDIYTWGYDTLGNVRSATTPGGKVLRYTHDARGRLTSITLPSGATTAFDIDPAGRPVRVRKADGSLIDLLYGANGRTMTVTSPSGTETTQVDLSGKVTSHVDARGETSIEYDGFGRIARWRGPRGNELSVSRDSSGRPSELQSGGNSTSLRYGSSGYLASVDTPEIDLEITRDASGLAVAMAFDDGSAATFDRNAVGLVTDSSWSHAGSPIFSEVRSYDGRSRLAAIQRSDGPRHDFEYDVNGRLVAETIEGLGRRQYAYDADNNMVTAALSGVTTDFEYDANDRLLRAGATRVGWDPNGNLARATTAGATESLSYDAFDRLVRYVRTGPDPVEVVYSYDFDGLLHSRCSAGDCRVFLWDRSVPGFPILREELDGSGALVRRYFNNGRFITHSVDASGVARKFILDHVGSPIRKVETSGNLAEIITYDAFGNAIEGLPGRIGWGGALLDEDSGLLFMRSRWYSPALRRFIQVDSAIPEASVPGTVNRYTFALNDPVNRTDPSGQWSLPEVSVTKGIQVSIAAGTAFAVVASGVNAFLPGGAFSGDNEFTAKFRKFGVFSLGIPLSGPKAMGGGAGVGIGLGIERLDLLRSSMYANYFYFGPSFGISVDLFGKRLGRWGGSAAVIGNSKIYNVYAPRDYEGPFAGVSGTFSIPPFVLSDSDIVTSALFNKGGALFWSPFRETRNQFTGEVQRPAWGWRLGNGLANRFGGSISLSFTFYLLFWWSPYLP